METRQVLTPSFGLATTFGNAFGNSDAATAITVDLAGNVYTTGRFGGTVDFDPGPESKLLTSTGMPDIFITKADPNGGLIWARSFRGEFGMDSYGIAVDGQGSVYTTGRFQDTVDFNPGGAVFNLTSVGGTGPGSLAFLDVFVSMLDMNGAFVWAKQFSSVANNAGHDAGRSIAVTPDGSAILVAGEFRGTVDFDPGAGSFPLNSNGLTDAFVAKLKKDGSLTWAVKLGGTQSDGATSIATDRGGAVYVGGTFSGTVDFNPGAGIHNLVSSGGTDGFVTKLSSAGGFTWATKVNSGSSFDGVTSIALSGTALAATGWFSGSSRFVSTAAGRSTTHTSAGGEDAFVIRLSTGTGLALTNDITGQRGRTGRLRVETDKFARL